jgi:hypothetical protein
MGRGLIGDGSGSHVVPGGLSTPEKRRFSAETWQQTVARSLHAQPRGRWRRWRRRRLRIERGERALPYTTSPDVAHHSSLEHHRLAGRSQRAAGVSAASGARPERQQGPASGGESVRLLLTQTVRVGVRPHMMRRTNRAVLVRISRHRAGQRGAREEAGSRDARSLGLLAGLAVAGDACLRRHCGTPRHDMGVARGNRHHRPGRGLDRLARIVGSPPPPIPGARPGADGEEGS